MNYLVILVKEHRGSSEDHGREEAGLVCEATVVRFGLPFRFATFVSDFVERKVCRELELGEDDGVLATPDGEPFQFAHFEGGGQRQQDVPRPVEGCRQLGRGEVVVLVKLPGKRVGQNGPVEVWLRAGLSHEEEGV